MTSLAPTATPTDASAEAAYDPEYFSRFRMTSLLNGDDFDIGPLVEAITLCATTVAPTSTPSAAVHAISMIGGGIDTRIEGPAIRSVAVYPSEPDARAPYDAIARALRTCDLELSKAISGGAYLIEPLTVRGGLAWRRTDLSTSGQEPPGSISRREVWTATIDGRALLVQHAPMSKTTTRAGAAHDARSLLDSAALLRQDLARSAN